MMRSICPGLLGGGLAVSWARAQDTLPPAELVGDELTVVQAIFSDLSFWAWPLGVILMFGVFWCAARYGVILLERSKVRAVLAEPIQRKSMAELELLIDREPKSQTVGLLRGMLDVATLGGGGDESWLGAVNEEITLYRESVNDRFEGFKAVAAFLANAAGALGLLGTVWGIYITFKGGEMDPEKIINGMGVALSTTGVGIVISLVIDFFSSVVVSAHVGLVELGLGKAEELRMALLAERKGATGAVTSRARLSSSRESPAEFSGPQ